MYTKADKEMIRITEEDKEIIRNHFCHEIHRRNTFIKQLNRTDVPISQSLLAKAGFFYIMGHVKCFSCDLTIDPENLRTSDDIIKIHKEKSPEFVFTIDEPDIKAVSNAGKMEDHASLEAVSNAENMEDHASLEAVSNAGKMEDHASLEAVSNAENTKIRDNIYEEKEIFRNYICHENNRLHTFTRNTFEESGHKVPIKLIKLLVKAGFFYIRKHI
ncbi:baculoviral IAP repeat-containing protein 3-like, partial [Penaeus chinensis]|uniref:baculoviral IAP repeat-containing protein 3-like n=1 Tax=Penaeus chinensis TaxID=139456 RepID=UPI001FB84305